MTTVQRRPNRHQEWMQSYYEEVERCRIAAENASLGYKTELAEYYAEHPLPTLKQWMKHREKAPEMPEQEFRSSWKGQDERAEEVAKVREMQDTDRAAEAAAEKVEMQRFLAVDIEQPTLQEMRDYNETGLLGAAMVTDEALPALRTVRNEFSDAFHADVARAILDQAADGAPHDAASVEAVLRERQRYELPEVLPEPLDPNQPWEPSAPEIPSQLPVAGEYGLQAWERAAVPDMTHANSLAQKIREDYRCRYLADVGTRLQESALTSAEAGEDPGLAFARSANELVNVPPRLDLDLREIKNTATLEAVDTRRPVRVVRAVSEATAAPLNIPARPATMNLQAAASA